MGETYLVISLFFETLQTIGSSPTLQYLIPFWLLLCSHTDFRALHMYNMNIMYTHTYLISGTMGSSVLLNPSSFLACRISLISQLNTCQRWGLTSERSLTSGSLLPAHRWGTGLVHGGPCRRGSFLVCPDFPNSLPKPSNHDGCLLPVSPNYLILWRRTSFMCLI